MRLMRRESVRIISFSLGILVNYRRWKYTNRRADAQGTLCVAQHDKAPNAARPFDMAKNSRDESEAVFWSVRFFIGASLKIISRASDRERKAAKLPLSTLFSAVALSRCFHISPEIQPSGGRKAARSRKGRPQPRALIFNSNFLEQISKERRNFLYVITTQRN
jgi:hypothetical protein